jgi:putative DNA primase/helicase
MQKGIDVVTAQIMENLQPPSSQKSDCETVEGDPLDEEAEIERLAQLSVIEYERAREDAAKAIGSRASILDKLVIAKRKELESDSDDAHGELSNGIEPWESPVDGRLVVQEIHGLLRRYTILPDGGYEAVTLWAIGSYVYDAFRIFPKLCLSSPEKRCGKTTLLETIGAMVSRALMASNMSPAVIFRAVEAWTPALLIDEGDTFLHGNEELRGIINSGHSR